MTPIEITHEGEQILSISQAANVVPHSETQLYRIARAGGNDSPFRKVGGRWCTTLTDLVAWVGAGQRGNGVSCSSDPMPTPARPRARGNSMRAMVTELRPNREHAA